MTEMKIAVTPRGRLDEVSDLGVLDPDELPLEVLLRLAKREIEDDEGDVLLPSLVALHRRSTQETFNHAAALACDSDPAQRELGVRILRELGDEQPSGRRPFSNESVPLLRARLRDETDPTVTSWIVSALGYHRAQEALPEVLAAADHPDDRVRFHVAAALPSMVDPDRVQFEAAAVLIRLCRDNDADTRFYALHAATREISSLDVAAITRLTEQLSNDPDDQVRTMAAAHHEAIGDLRKLLIRVLGPGAHDHLIGPVLVALACVGDIADGGLLNETIRRHLGTASARSSSSSLVEQLLTWWTSRRDRIVRD
jgi:HEAT repeat protein